MSENILNFIDAIQAGDFVAAKSSFDDEVAFKQKEAIDTARIQVASTYYNDVEPPEMESASEEE